MARAPGPHWSVAFRKPDESRRRGVIMEAIAGVDIAIWDVKAQALGAPLYQALGAVRSAVRGYASGGWAPGDEAEAELGGYAAKGFTAVKMRDRWAGRLLDPQLRAAGQSGAARDWSERGADD